ncbi:hypothetical protein EU527_04695 [Candidatus Thorarchaeota archaeon]|nr:MAG: hypothetical protein EU527_04695 [Candidatus Thorarchaeota archaeon]
MDCLLFKDGLKILVTFGTPMDDIVATLPYVIPLVFFAITLLLYQRHLPQDNITRNLMVFSSLSSLIISFGLLLYAASSVLWWTFGSWASFSSGLQAVTDFIFSSVGTSLVYVIIIGILFTVFSYFVISPPNPDLSGLREDLKLTKEVAYLSKQALQKLEAENKRLNEFIIEKEQALTTLESELETIKAEVAERETSIEIMEEQLKSKKIPSSAEDTLRAQIAERDASIESLQSEIADLRLTIENTETATAPSIDSGKIDQLHSQLQNLNARWEDLLRRSETASEVSDSVITDLVELISQVESSGREVMVKEAFVSLIEGLGRSMTRVAREAGNIEENEPKIELIGAIIMVNEIIDAVKKMVRA